MDQLVDIVTGNGVVAWVGSVLLVGVAINLTSNFLQRTMDQYWQGRVEKTRSRKVKKETALLLKLSRMKRSTEYLMIYVTANMLLIGWLIFGFLLAMQFYVIAKLPPVSTLENIHFLDEPLSHSAKQWFMLAIWTIMALVMTLLASHIFRFMDTLRRLLRFKEQEEAYLSLVGEFPAGYEPLHRDEITPPATA